MPVKFGRRWKALVLCIGLKCTDNTEDCQLKTVMCKRVIAVDETDHLQNCNVNCSEIENALKLSLTKKVCSFWDKLRIFDDELGVGILKQ